MASGGSDGRKKGGLFSAPSATSLEELLGPTADVAESPPGTVAADAPDPETMAQFVPFKVDVSETDSGGRKEAIEALLRGEEPAVVQFVPDPAPSKEPGFEVSDPVSSDPVVPVVPKTDPTAVPGPGAFAFEPAEPAAPPAGERQPLTPLVQPSEDPQPDEPEPPEPAEVRVQVEVEPSDSLEDLPSEEQAARTSADLDQAEWPLPLEGEPPADPSGSPSSTGLPYPDPLPPPPPPPPSAVAATVEEVPSSEPAAYGDAPRRRRTMITPPEEPEPLHPAAYLLLALLTVAALTSLFLPMLN